ncbi:MAG: hypothetical protein ACF8XB_02345, partial [Planctomycetota bacterium JB042]
GDRESPPRYTRPMSPEETHADPTDAKAAPRGRGDDGRTIRQIVGALSLTPLHGDPRALRLALKIVLGPVLALAAIVGLVAALFLLG